MLKNVAVLLSLLLLAPLAGCRSSDSQGSVRVVFPVSSAQTVVSGVTVRLTLEQESLPISPPLEVDLEQIGDVATAQLSFAKVPYGLTLFVVEFEWLQPGGAQAVVLRAEKEVDLDEPNENVEIGQDDIVLNADTDRDGVADLSELLQGRDPLVAEECAANADCSVGSICTAFECVPLTCGNNLIDGTGERCDGADLGTATCTSQGFTGGTLACGPDCKFDNSGCQGTGFVCGDGSQDGDEVCETGSTVTCTSLDNVLFVGGMAPCDLSDCLSFDTSGCITCGNGMLDGDEECDGTTFMSGDSCTARSFPGGNLTCTAQCAVSTANCDAPATCPDGDIDAGEQCDGSDLGGADCTTTGAMPAFEGGSLSCNANCSFNTSQCHRCGDNVQAGPEECDGTDIPVTCDQVLGVSGAQGTPTCTSCVLNVSDCSFCGNNIAEMPREECDGVPEESCDALTGGQFTEGEPTCTSACMHDAGSCTNGSCVQLGGDCGTGTCCGTPTNVCDPVSFRCCVDLGGSCASGGPCCDPLLCGPGDTCEDPGMLMDGGGGGDSDPMCANLGESCSETVCCSPYQCDLTMLCDDSMTMMPDGL